MKRKRRILLLLAAAMTASLSGGLVWATHSEPAAPDLAPIQSNYSLGEAKAFTRFPVYYAGESVNGYPLRAVQHDAAPVETISFLYGDCTPPRDLEGHYDGGCALPVDVQVWPACERLT